MQEIALLAELAQNGLTWTNGAGKDVNIVYLAYADLNQALRQKQIDAMSRAAQGLERPAQDDRLRHPRDRGVDLPGGPVVVMTYRPGTVKRVLTVPLARPRETAALEFNELKKLVSQLVMEEQMRHASDELRGATAD